MRPAPDACPGVLRPFAAEDGAMVRIRLPGGRIHADALRRLTELATTYGNGILQLTSRAGVQLRGLPDPLPTALVTEIAATGVLPSTTHERVRNIVASPLTGIDGGLVDLAPLVGELDAGLLADPVLAALSGRFLFVLDDGRGDVVGLRFDLAYQATGADTGYVLVGSAERGLATTAPDAASLLLRLARDFVAAREHSGAWHVTELPAWTSTLPLEPVTSFSGSPTISLGRVGDAASVSVPLARLRVEQAHRVRQLAGDRTVVVTPWRGLVIPAAGDQLAALDEVGLVVDDDAAWSRLSACVGAPYCGKARSDTAAIAHAVAAQGGLLERTHIAGCERRCGAPIGVHLDLIAPTIEQALRATRARQPVGS